MATYLEQAMQHLKEFEGSVPWMYLDTVGKVTVGVGLMLVDEMAAHALPFVIGERRATLEEIKREFARVQGMKKGLLSKAYATKPQLRLSPEAIDEKLRVTLLGFEGYLRSHIGNYDQLPETAKLALLDMIYNLGPGRLFSEYPRLLAALDAGDWKAAAAASGRRGPSGQRNAWTRQQFLAAAKIIALEAGAEVSRTGVMLLGLLSGIAAAAAVAILLGEFNAASIDGSPQPR